MSINQLRQFQSFYKRNPRPPTQLQQITRFNSQSQIKQLSSPHEQNKQSEGQINNPFILRSSSQKSSSTSTHLSLSSYDQQEIIFDRISAKISFTTGYLVIILTFLQFFFFISYDRFNIQHLKALLSCGIIIFMLIIDQSFKWCEWIKCILMEVLGVYAFYLKSREYLQTLYIEKWENVFTVVEMAVLLMVVIQVDKRIYLAMRKRKARRELKQKEKAEKA